MLNFQLKKLKKNSFLLSKTRTYAQPRNIEGLGEIQPDPTQLGLNPLVSTEEMNRIIQSGNVGWGRKEEQFSNWWYQGGRLSENARKDLEIGLKYLPTESYWNPEWKTCTKQEFDEHILPVLLYDTVKKDYADFLENEANLDDRVFVMALYYRLQKLVSSLNCFRQQPHLTHKMIKDVSFGSILFLLKAVERGFFPDDFLNLLYLNPLLATGPYLNVALPAEVGDEVGINPIPKSVSSFRFLKDAFHQSLLATQACVDILNTQRRNAEKILHRFTEIKTVILTNLQAKLNTFFVGSQEDREQFFFDVRTHINEFFESVRGRIFEFANKPSWTQPLFVLSFLGGCLFIVTCIFYKYTYSFPGFDHLRELLRNNDHNPTEEELRGLQLISKLFTELAYHFGDVGWRTFVEIARNVGLEEQARLIGDGVTSVGCSLSSAFREVHSIIETFFTILPSTVTKDVGALLEEVGEPPIALAFVIGRGLNFVTTSNSFFLKKPYKKAVTIFGFAISALLANNFSVQSFIENNVFQQYEIILDKIIGKLPETINEMYQLKGLDPSFLQHRNEKQIFEDLEEFHEFRERKFKDRFLFTLIPLVILFVKLSETLTKA